MAGEVKTVGSDEIALILEQLPEGVLVVDQDGVVLFANKPGCKLLKMKPKTAVSSRFAYPIEDGNMRDFDVEMSVKPIAWLGTPARLLHLKSLKSAGAFHLEWKLEAALERAREAEEALQSLKSEMESAPAPGVVVNAEETAHYEERIAELETLLELAENRADELQSGLVFDDHQRATELQDAIAHAREAEEQVRQLEADLADSRERIRVAEEQAEVAEERAYSLETELEELLAEKEEWEAEREAQGTDSESVSRELEELGAQLQVALSERDNLREELEEAVSLRESLEQTRTSLEEARANLELARAGEERAAQLDLEVSELKERIALLESGADVAIELEAKLAQKLETITALEAEVEGLRDQVSTSAEESEELAEQLRVETEQFEERHAALQSELDGVFEERDRLQSDLEQLRADLSAAEEERDSVLLQLEDATKATEERSVEALDLQQKVSELEAVGSEAEQLKKEVRRLQALLEQAEELAEKGEKVEKLERKLEGALRRAEEAEERLLEERRLLGEIKQKLEKVSQESRETIPGEATGPETERLAFQDDLTGLPNRNIIQRYLGFMLKQSARYNRFTAMLRIDCDNFKTINDTFGSEVGDQLIRAVGERLSSVVRGSDVLGRFAEDEFIMLLSEMADQDEASVVTAMVIKRLYQKMMKPFVVGDQSITVEVSVGVSLYPTDAKNGEQMFEHAAVALKRAKDTGRGAAQYFTSDLQTAHVARNDMENELKIALEQKQLELVYQPIFDLSTGQIVGLESLLRWNHPAHGKLIPKHFLQIAEDSGIIVLIGHWVLREAITRAAEWNRAKLTEFVSVNLSRRQLLQADLLPTIQSVLSEVGCSPERLLIEVSESLTGADLPQVKETLIGLQKMGVRLAVDNFGTASSSLKELRRGPFQVLKVDRSFVAGIPGNDEYAGLLLSALTVGHHLGRIAIAVGVENQQQKEWLVKTGCRFAQGNALSEPLSVVQISELVRARR